jgi:hypothetical protein
MFEQISMFKMLNPVESRFTHECRRGSGFEGGRVRIYCASCNLGIKDLALYLKDEYGVGGHSATFPDCARGFTDYNASGLTIRAWKSNETEKHSWQEVAKEIKRLIFSGEYLNEKEWAKVQEISQQTGGPLPKPYPRIRLEVKQ